VNRVGHLRRVAAVVVAVSAGAGFAGVPGSGPAVAQSTRPTVLITVIPQLPPPPGSPTTLPPAVLQGDKLVIPLEVPTIATQPAAVPVTTARPAVVTTPLAVATAKPVTKTTAKKTTVKKKATKTTVKRRVCVARNRKGTCTKYR
jgi:hypothetical protein